MGEMTAGGPTIKIITAVSSATADHTWNLTKSLPLSVNLYISEPNALEARGDLQYHSGSRKL